jgi:hypothetical protein
MEKKKKPYGRIARQGAFKRKCPFVDQPFDYCYCSSMNSSDTKNVILYCGGIFEECKFYKNKMKQGD